MLVPHFREPAFSKRERPSLGWGDHWQRAGWQWVRLYAEVVDPWPQLDAESQRLRGSCAVPMDRCASAGSVNTEKG